MTLEEAIQYAEDLGTEEENKIDYDKDSPHTIIRKKNTVKDYRQLAGWLRELKEAKRFLKAVIDDMNANNFCCKFDSCKVCSKRYSISCNKKFQWHYSDEALKLIGDEPNV